MKNGKERHPLPPRRWETTLAEDVPAGPQGQPEHKAGSKLTVVMSLNVPGAGNVALPVPRGSSILLSAADQHLRRAARLRRQFPTQLRQIRWHQPGHDKEFRHENLPFDFFQDAMSGVVLVHAALDNYASEMIPEGFALENHQGRVEDRAVLEGRGIEYRLSRVLAAVTERPNLMTEGGALWGQVVELKTLRDDVGHAKRQTAFSPDDAPGTIYGRLVSDPDLTRHIDTVSDVVQHYGTG